VVQDSVLDVLVTSFDSLDFDPPPAVIAGAQSETTIDTDGDGLHDRLEVVVDLLVNEPGDFRVSGELVGAVLSLAVNETVSVSSAPATVQAVLSFDGAAIHHHREDGPFELHNLRLRNLADGSELDFVANAWTTAALPFAAFEHGAVVMAEDSFADAPGFPDADGKFRSLDLSFDVAFDFDAFVDAAFPSPGRYRVMASLEDAQGRTVSSTNAAVFLTAVNLFGSPTVTQLVELSFTGTDIFDSGVDGPYFVTGVTLLSEDGRLVDQNAKTYETAAYAASDFSGTREEVMFEDGFE
jgi:hypothetical protein